MILDIKEQHAFWLHQRCIHWHWVQSKARPTERHCESYICIYDFRADLFIIFILQFFSCFFIFSKVFTLKVVLVEILFRLYLQWFKVSLDLRNDLFFGSNLACSDFRFASKFHLLSSDALARPEMIPTSMYTLTIARHAIDAAWQILTFANRSAKTYAFLYPKSLRLRDGWLFVEDFIYR